MALEPATLSTPFSSDPREDRVAVVHEGLLLGVYRRESSRWVAERVMPS